MTENSIKLSSAKEEIISEVENDSLCLLLESQHILLPG